MNKYCLSDEQARMITSLLDVTADICRRIPEIYRDHGEGQAQENQVLVNLRAALDSMERARALAQGDEHVLATVDHGIAFLMQQIEEHKEMRDAWAISAAVVEAARSTKH